MSLIHVYYDPATEFERVFEDALATRFCPRGVCASSTKTASRHHDTYRPRLDLLESKDTNTMTATLELPGLKSDDIAINVHQNRLTVSGKSADVDSRGERSYIVRERRSGTFSRTLQLPIGIKVEDVKAKMENGILTITFPKTSEQHAERIAIH